LISHYYQGDLAQAVRQALSLVKGTYGVAVVCRHEPGVIVGARLGSPLVIGLGGDGTYLASDANALAGYADKVVYLQDRQMCVLNDREWSIRDAEDLIVDSTPNDIKEYL